MSEDDRRFRFDQLDQTGVLLGLGFVQLGFLGIGLIFSGVAISAGVTGPLAMAPVGVCAAVAFGRIKGRPMTEWLPVIVVWGISGAVRGRTWLADLPRTGRGIEPSPHALPPTLTGLTIVEASSPWHRIAKVGLVHDQQDQTLTVIVPVRGHDFALLETNEQADLLSRWGDVLAAFTRERGLVVRLSWTEFAAPVGLDDHRRWVDDAHAEGGSAEGDDAVIESYRQAVHGGGQLTAEHQVLVSLTTSRARVRTSRRATTPDTDAFIDATIAATEALLRGLRGAGLEPSGRDHRILPRLDH